MEDETKEDGVDQFLEKTLRSKRGKKSFANQKQFVFAK